MSTAPDSVFERTFANDLSELEQVTEEALAFAEQFEMSAAAGYSLRLSIEEIATNILKYAYEDTAPHRILLRAEMLQEQIHLSLEDDGREFDPLTVPEPNTDLPVEERNVGGLGIHLIRKFALRTHYQRLNGRNRLSVWLKR